MTDTQRYDRQLRLWGDAAQQRLENARLLFIGSDCTATESLKSIILPGIGHVTIADTQIIDDYDLETNFFIEMTDNGKQRGEIVLKNLLELNDRVKGEFIQKSLGEINNEKTFVNGFDIIVCSNQIHEEVITLSTIAECPVLEVVTNGYFGYVKGYFKSHVIFDDGADTLKMDLRISHPFPKLQEYFDSFDFTTMTKEQHKHVPFPVILYWALNQWQQQNNTTNVPKTMAQKNELKAIIKKEAKSLFLEENFGEAHLNVHYIWSEMNGNVSGLLADERAMKSTKGMNKYDVEFWTFIYAVKVFKERHGRTPVDSTIKDMICGNEDFTRLQKVFTDQLHEDATELLTIIEEKMKNDETVDIVSFDLEKVKNHCKTLRKMNQYDGVDGTVNETWENQAGLLAKDENGDYYDKLGGTLQDLAAFVSIFDFYKKHQRYPCGEEDVEEMMTITSETLKKKTIEEEPERIHVEEICRFGGVQIHSSCSVVGSFVAQTVIHFTTHKFAGLNNTFFFDTTTSQALYGKF